MLLVIMLIANIFLMGKSYANKEENILDEVEIKEMNYDKTFAIMLGDKEGIYSESKENIWPSKLKYNYNETRSGCIDNYGNKIEGILTYNSETEKVTVVTKKTTYCYLYFDLDGVAPQEFTFYLGGITNPTYTNNLNVTNYINFSDKDIEEYCITEESTSENCTWNKTNGLVTITPSYTISSGEGEKTLYA